MSRKCPRCESGENVRTKYGSFVRHSDQRRIQRYKCKACGHIYSKATFQLCYKQKKRRINPRVLELLCSNVSQRRIALLLKITRATVVRKFLFLSAHAKEENFQKLFKLSPITHFQFDDMETVEHTKCKPLSVFLAVEEETRRILALSVSQMAAKGHLSKISLKRYGPRPDKRNQGRDEVFSKIRHKVAPEALIESDENPHYLETVTRFFPKAQYKTYLSEKSSVAGQGELKKVRYDPLFTINHTFAMCRANINRLIRKSWCTTKKPERLKAHLELFMYFHNEVLLPKRKNLSLIAS